jgi:hypothetical protein
MIKKRKRRYNEISYILKNNKDLILNGIFGTQTEYQVESAVCFANYLNHVGINNKNYLLFLKLIETNNKWILDALIGNRDAHLLFTTIKPNRNLMKKAFQLLTFWHPDQIYSKTLLAILGIIECGFYKPDDGYKIYRLTITDLNNLGKYLKEEKDQDDYENKIVLEILDRISKLGEYKNYLHKSVLSKHAFNIRFGYFDHRRNLLDIIPQVLLVRINREQSEVNPSKEFIKFVKDSLKNEKEK